MKRAARLLVVLVVIALGAGWWWSRQSLPSLDGEIRVSGLAAPVEVLIDAHGVPHVYASGPEDAWFAAGMLHARDRLWQMELYRRAASGRLAEVLGRDALEIDRHLLTLGLRDAAEAEWRDSPPAVRAALERYAAGVNAHLAQAAGRRRPPEFQILRFSPVQWTPVDSLLIGRLLAWRLAENHQAEMVRHALAAKFGTADALQLSGAATRTVRRILDGPSASRDPDAGADVASLDVPRTDGSGEPAPGEASRAGWPRGLEWLHPQARKGNSNNWVVSGRRTATGRPLLANDPHLQMEFPGVWYEMHLVAADLDVIGVTIPGTPFVVIGHNARIAWGLTNTGADVQDLFIERLDLASRRYLHQGQWVPVEVKTHDIPVRGGDFDRFEVWKTRHGSIVADVGVDWEHAPGWLSSGSERKGEQRAFALRWDAVTGTSAAAFEALNRATDWASFNAAIDRFASPSQNIVYADVDGNIGYAMSGALPLRATGSGMMPNDGGSGDGDWVGSVSASALPRRLNPPAGFIASANNPVGQSSVFITHDWALSFRAERLHDTLSRTERLDLPGAAALQNDVTSVAAAEILGAAESAIAAGRRRSADQAALGALEQLRAWDRQVDGRPVVMLYELFEAALWKRTFADEMGDALFATFYRWGGAERPAGIYTILDEPSSRWYDDIATINRRETRDDIFVLAAADAVEQLAREHPGETPWTAAHVARFAHPIGDAARPLSWLFNRGPVPMSGDGTTVMRTSYDRSRPFGIWEVPSWRQIFDVGSWDDARVILPAGQSGHPLSPHYFDQNQMWRQGQYRRQPFSRTAVDAAQKHRLLLLP